VTPDAKKTKDTIQTNHSGMSLSFLESASYWTGVLAVGLTAAAAATGVFFWYFSTSLASVKDAAFNRFKEESKVAVASANEKAAQATARALEAQLALEKFKAPRTLTPEQRDRIVDKLKQFSGTEYDITISEYEPEILDFVLTLELVLSTAGWTELDWKGTGEALIRGGEKALIREGVAVTNVLIGVQTDQPPELFKFALALSDALEAEGVTATAGKHIRHEMSSTNANAIHIMIGRKQ
jgi:hypothetical protein